jgi:hypothetical protein
MMTNLDPSLSGRLAEFQHRPEEMAAPRSVRCGCPRQKSLPSAPGGISPMFLAPPTRRVWNRRWDSPQSEHETQGIMRVLGTITADDVRRITKRGLNT